MVQEVLMDQGVLEVQADQEVLMALVALADLEDLN